MTISNTFSLLCIASILKFSDPGIQDISSSISIRFKVEYVNDLTERYESDDESDKHLEARDRRYSCLMSTLAAKKSD